MTLTPLTPSHALTLYTTIGGPQNNHLWTYLPTGPYPDRTSFNALVDTLISSPSYFPFVILASKSNPNKENGKEEIEEKVKGGKAVGIACYLGIEPENRRIEIGAIVFGEELKGTRGGTEALGLLIGEGFRLGFLRVCFLLPIYLSIRLLLLPYFLLRASSPFCERKRIGCDGY